jgi:hypothetical protein
MHDPRAAFDMALHYIQTVQRPPTIYIKSLTNKSMHDKSESELRPDYQSLHYAALYIRIAGCVQILFTLDFNMVYYVRTRIRK